MGLHSYSWTSSEPPSVNSGEQSSRQYGIPRTCYCGSNPVILTCDPGLHMRRRYYACKNRDKWWDNAVMEEVQEIKMEKDSLEDRVRYINGDSEGAVVDPRMMWNNVLHSRDEVYRLHVLSEAAEAKIEELKEKVEELGRRDMRAHVDISAMVVKEMKILNAIGLYVALVAFLILLFK